MKLRFLLSILFSLFLLVGCTDKKPDGPLNQKPNVLPTVKEWQAQSGFFELTKNTTVSLTENISSVALFVEDLALLSGKSYSLAEGKKTGEISFSYSNDAGFGEEGYSIAISEKVEVLAGTEKGIFNATQTLLQILKQEPDHNRLPRGYIKDNPILNERAFMMDVGRRYYEVPYLKKVIRNMAWQKLNVLHLHFSDWSGFRLKSDKFPTLASEQAYSKQDIRDLQDYAKQYHIMIVPEIDLPAHATHIIKWNPDLAFSCESMRNTIGNNWLPQDLNPQNPGWILDVSKPQTKQFIKELFDEFIPLFDGPYFHVGGDEWQYDKQKMECPELVAATKQLGYQYPGDIFVAWINEVNAQVKSYGKTTQIWSWWNFSSSAEKQNVTSISPDKDVVVNVWNKETQGIILQEGYNIISTFEDGPEALYITPGLNGKVPGDYGFFDSKSIYENWQPETSEQFKGYKVCLWADRAEQQSDEWFNQYYEVPLMVFAEKAWGVKGSADFPAFLESTKKIGFAPYPL